MLFTLENRKFFDCSREERESLIPFVRETAELANIIQAKGMLALEPMLPDFEDEFLRYALNLIVDAEDPDEVRRRLEVKAVGSGKTGLDLLRMVITIECVLKLCNGSHSRIVEESGLLYLGDVSLEAIG